MPISVAWRLRLVAEEDASLHVRGLLHARERERSRREVQRAHELVTHRAGLEVLRRGDAPGPADDERHMQAVVIHELLAAHMGLPVVAHEEHHRVVREAVGFELREDDANLPVQLARGVEILRPVRARDRVVRVDGRQLHLCRVSLGRSLERAMRLLKVDLRVERLVRLQLAPLVGVEGLARIGEIPVRFAAATKAEARGQLAQVRREVARLAEAVGGDLHAGGELVAVVAMRAVMMRADGGLIHPGHEGRPARAAHRRSGERPREAHPLTGQLVEIRCPNFLRAVAAEVRRKVLADEPEDVRTRRGGGVAN